MKIVIDARIISSSTGRYIERLLTHLEDLKSEHQFIVLVPEKDKDYWRPRAENFEVRVADFKNYSFEEQLSFNTFLQHLDADLVHFCMPQQPVLYRGKKVTTVHDLNLLRITETDDMHPLVLNMKQKIFGWLLKKVSRDSQAVLVPSEYTKHDLISYSRIPEDKVSLTYEAADKLAASPASVPEFDNKQFLLFVGRAEPYKNNRGLIRAHQLLLSKLPSLQLVFVGKIDEFRRRDLEWVRQEGYKNVTFFGFASNEQLAWLYENCTAYVFPSFMEGFGLPGLEAMLHGAPVISSDATCLPEVYGDAAMYFDAHNPTQMAAAIEAVVTDKKLADTLRSKGFEQADKFSWRRMAEQTLEVYERALTSKK